jgi:hypothetical protein
MFRSAVNPAAAAAVQAVPPAGAARGAGATRRHTPPWAWALPLVLILFLYLARAILGPFIIAGVLAYIFSPVVDQVQERVRVPRAVAVGSLYLLVLALSVPACSSGPTRCTSKRATSSPEDRISSSRA